MSAQADQFVRQLSQRRTLPKLEAGTPTDDNSPISGPQDPRWKTALPKPEPATLLSLDQLLDEVIPISEPSNVNHEVIARAQVPTKEARRVIVSHASAPNHFVVALERDGEILSRTYTSNLDLLPLLREFAVVLDLTTGEA